MPWAPRLRPGERRRLDVVHGPLADPQAREDHGRDPADLGHRVDDACRRPGLELELAGQLARDHGALGAGVDDEAIRALRPPMLTGTVIRSVASGV